MKKQFLLFNMLALFFVTGLYSQNQIKDVSAEATSVTIQANISTEEDNIKTKWLSLQKLNGSEYEEMFLTLLLDPLSQEQFQTYALAESLWYKTQIDQSDLKKNTDSKLNETIDYFLENLGTGAIIPQEYSDTVYSMFTYFTNNNIVPFSNLPELNIFLATETLHVPTEEQKIIKIYRGGVALEKLKNQIQENPTYENIDIMSILSNPPLFYALQNSPDMEPLYTKVMEFADGLPTDSKPLMLKCIDLINQLELISLKRGFVSKDLLPVFSSTLLKEYEIDEFVLCCLPAQDLEKFVTDLEGLILFSSIYYSRITDSLCRVQNLNNVQSGGSL